MQSTRVIIDARRPTVVAFVGIGPYRIVSGIKDARVGLQMKPFGGRHAWVLPNPSGLNEHYQPAALARLFSELRVWANAEHGGGGKKTQVLSPEVAKSLTQGKRFGAA